MTILKKQTKIYIQRQLGKMENKLLEINLNETTEYDFDDFTQNLEYELFQHKIEFPVTLEAVASNWRGQTGYAEAKNQSDLISKISSFEPSYAELLYQYQQADETAGGYMSEPIGEAIKELENLT